MEFYLLIRIAAVLAVVAGAAFFAGALAGRFLWRDQRGEAGRSGEDSEVTGSGKDLSRG